MLVKLADPEDVTPLSASPVDPTTIKTMVDYYRTNRRKDSNSLKFAHFPLSEVIQLLIDNGVISPLSLPDQNKIRSYGVKLYVGNHANDINTCPGKNPNYIDKDTIIVCLTQLIPRGVGMAWADLLDKSVTVSIPGYVGMGLDKSTICPPDCPTTANPYTDDISSIP